MSGASRRQSPAACATADRRSDSCGDGMREFPGCADAPGASEAAVQSTNPLALLDAALRQLADLLEATSDEQYVRKPVGVIAGSLGGHVRHCLDHFEALCSGVSTGVMDYDDRERGTLVETDRSAARGSIRRLKDRVALLDVSMLPRAVRVRSMLDGDGTSIDALSSLGRELAFVLSHTVHHNALIAAMCRTLGVPIAERFGYAPSTVAHLAGSTCAR